MRITDIFDAVRDATYSDFRKFYTGDPNLFHKYTGLSLFQLLFVNDHNIYAKEFSWRNDLVSLMEGTES